MSMKCICDRCGAIIEDDEGASFEIRSRADKTNVLEHGDLCLACENKLSNWICAWAVVPQEGAEDE